MRIGEGFDNAYIPPPLGEEDFMQILRELELATSGRFFKAEFQWEGRVRRNKK